MALKLHLPVENSCYCCIMNFCSTADGCKLVKFNQFFKKLHDFHIPVMGTGFTIDTPLKVAKYGINSVVPLTDDVLIERVRKFYCEKFHLPYRAITQRDKDARAKRITAYLNLLDKLVKEQFQKLKAAPFAAGSEITKYFELLPENPLKKLYRKMLQEKDRSKKEKLQSELRRKIMPGRIEVNIMTKLDRDKHDDGSEYEFGFSEALATLRGYAKSKLSNSAVVFSAGFNPRLYSYVTKFKDFFPNGMGEMKKHIVLKVSDYRSALIQGKFLAKRGLWVSEYRVESALNCGGHAFLGSGALMGPVLEEFKNKRKQLLELLQEVYQKAVKTVKDIPDKFFVTAQGGVGTHEEQKMLMQYYELDSVGWGTPFMLVPEVVNIDDKSLAQLSRATEQDVYLSDTSPLNVRFWSLRYSGSEVLRDERIASGTPGAACIKGYAKLFAGPNGKPICLASCVYQRQQLLQLAQQENLTPEQREARKNNILGKACICHDLGGSVEIKYQFDVKAAPAICCGPNIANFTQIVDLRLMVDHIYGKISLLTNKNRPHMFIKELMLYMAFIQEEIDRSLLGLLASPQKKLEEIKENLFYSIDYYQKFAVQLAKDQKENFLLQLEQLRQDLISLPN